MARKVRKKAMRIALRIGVSGSGATVSTTVVSGAIACSAFARGGVSSRGFIAKIGKRSSSFAIAMPQGRPIMVARTAAGTNAVGSLEPEIARIPIAVVGMSWIDAVLMTRKVTMAFVGTPL